MANLSLSALPPEITTIIVDLFRLDRPMLKVCSLVCKAWLNRAYRHLHAEKTFTQQQIRKLFKLESPIIPFVRRFSFNACHDTQFWDGTPWPLILAFESIRSLSIVNLQWSMHRFTAKRLSALHTQFAFINRLALSNAYFQKFSHLVQIISGFPRLETLSISSAEWALSDTPSATLCLPPNLRSLELRNCPRDFVLDWLLSLPRTPPFHTFSFDAHSSSTLERFLQFLVPYLKAIFVHSSNGYNEWPIHLTHHTSLRTVFFYLPYALSTRTYHSAIIQLLSGIGSVDLERVVLDFKFSDIPRNSFPWNELDAILVRPEWPNLKRVEIRSLYSRIFGKIPTPYRPIPRCQERGLVVFEEKEAMVVSIPRLIHLL